MAPSQFESPPVNRHVTELPTSVRLRTLLGSVCLLVGVGTSLRAAEPNQEIVPIQFAEQFYQLRNHLDLVRERLKQKAA